MTAPAAPTARATPVRPATRPTRARARAIARVTARAATRAITKAIARATPRAATRATARAATRATRAGTAPAVIAEPNDRTRKKTGVPRPFASTNKGEARARKRPTLGSKDMSEVLSLHRERIRASIRAEPDVIEILEEFLNEARRGEIIAAAIALVRPDGAIRSCVSA